MMVFGSRIIIRRGGYRWRRDEARGPLHAVGVHVVIAVHLEL
jgi:hypothetical protein